MLEKTTNKTKNFEFEIKKCGATNKTKECEKDEEKVKDFINKIKIQANIIE